MNLKRNLLFLIISLLQISLSAGYADGQLSTKITPKSITLFSGLNRLDVRHLHIQNPGTIPLSIHALFDTSWVMVYPTFFALNPGESKDIKAFFITDNFKKSASQKSIIFMNDENDAHCSVFVEIRDYKRPSAISRNTLPPKPEQSPPQKALVKPANTISETREINQKARDQLLKIYRDFIVAISPELGKNEVKINLQDKQFILTIPGTIIYDQGESGPKTNAIPLLKKIGRLLGEKLIPGICVEIRGHTDNIPIGDKLSKEYESNWELSTARAATIARFFQSNFGIPGTSITAIGYSFFKPIVQSDNENIRSINRRLEIAVKIDDNN